MATTRNGEELHYSPASGVGSSLRYEIDLAPGSLSSDPRELTAFGDSIFFSAHTPSSIVTGGGREVWVATGTEVRPLKDIMPGTASSDPDDFTVVGNTLYFTANSSGKGRELWKTDGTAQGTQLVRDIHVRLNASAYPRDLVAYQGNLFFTADDGVRGRELWRTDGSHCKWQTAFHGR